MWTRQNYTTLKLNPHLQLPTSLISSIDDDISWEEQAFAEDASGSLGGCVWPPRSYTCSFCRREFKSAQALGGHMNVHRRDRARLKLSPTDEIPQEVRNHHQQECITDRNQLVSSGFDQVSTFRGYNPNPNSLLGLFRVPSNNQEFPSLDVDLHKKSSLKSPTSIDNNLKLQTPITTTATTVIDINKQEEKTCKIVESSVDKDDVSVSLGLVLKRTRPISPTILSDDESEEHISGKRRKTDMNSLPILLKSRNSIAKQISPCSVEELDLELRLGERPKWCSTYPHYTGGSLEVSLRVCEERMHGRWREFCCHSVTSLTHSQFSRNI